MYTYLRCFMSQIRRNRSELAHKRVSYRLFSSLHRAVPTTMPPPLNVDLDPNIAAFEVICDRLSNIEESVGILRAHMRRENMCRKSGLLDSQLLGFPSSLRIKLNADDGTSGDELPFIENSTVTIHCNDTCSTTNMAKFYYPMYRRCFPEQAEAIIAAENLSGKFARCADFGITATSEFVYTEVEDAAKREGIDTTRFDAFFVEQDDESCGMILMAKRRDVDLFTHISQGLKVVFARGHTPECIQRVDITPCAATYLRAALAFQRLGLNPSGADVLQFRQEHKIRPGNSWFSYFENHPFLGDYSDQVQKMDRALGI
jgi:hypothetical protein